MKISAMGCACPRDHAQPRHVNIKRDLFMLNHNHDKEGANIQ